VTTHWPAGEITVADALARLQAWHFALSQAGFRLADTYRKARLTIPCEVRDLHNIQVSEYLRAARAIFEQLQAKGVPTTQFVYDSSGKVTKELRPTTDNPYPMPVAPLSFVVSDCPRANKGLGVVPFVVMAVLSGALAVSILVVGQALGQRIMWPGGPPPKYTDVADKYTDCLQKNPARTDLCLPLVPPRAADWPAYMLTAALLIGTVVGGVMVYRKYA